MRDMLRLRGCSVNEKRVRRLMRKMDLLGDLPTEEPSVRVLCRAIYIPTYLGGLKNRATQSVMVDRYFLYPYGEGFYVPYAVIDVYSRFVVG